MCNLCTTRSGEKLHRFGDAEKQQDLCESASMFNARCLWVGLVRGFGFVGGGGILLVVVPKDFWLVRVATRCNV